MTLSTHESANLVASASETPSLGAPQQPCPGFRAGLMTVSQLAPIVLSRATRTAPISMTRLPGAMVPVVSKSRTTPLDGEGVTDHDG